MAAFRSSPRPSPSGLTLLPALGGGLVGALAAVAIALLPAESFQDLVWTSGVTAFLPAAQPPLGMTARLLVAISLGAATAAVCWAVLYLLIGPGGLMEVRRKRVRARASGVPVVRRADAHPDAPPRAPMSAADLGTPLMEIVAPVEQPLPDDLDQPLAAFDPYAVLASPREPVRPVTPLAIRQSVEPTPSVRSEERPEPIERIEPVDSPMPIRVATAPAATPAATNVLPDTPPTIESLLRRLEQGARRREARAG